MSGEGGDGNVAGGGSGGVAGGGTTEPVIPADSLVYWFSADFGVTETEGGISAWLDRSGNHRDAAQPQAESRPKLEQFAGSELPAVVFDGFDDYFELPALTASFGAGVTFFSVVRATSRRDCMNMLEVSNGSEFEEVSFFQFRDSFTYEVGDNVLSGQQGAFVVAEPRMLDVTHLADQGVSLFLNGLPTGFGAFPLPLDRTRSQNYVGRSLYPDCTTWAGEIAEVLLYARALRTEEREAIRLYLDEKWGCCDASAGFVRR